MGIFDSFDPHEIEEAFSDGSASEALLDSERLRLGALLIQFIGEEPGRDERMEEIVGNLSRGVSVSSLAGNGEPKDTEDARVVSCLALLGLSYLRQVKNEIVKMADRLKGSSEDEEDDGSGTAAEE